MTAVRGGSEMGPKVSSFCAVGGCVHVQLVGDQVLVMAEPAARTALVFSREEWTAFLAGVRNGEFDLDALAAEPT